MRSIHLIFFVRMPLMHVAVRSRLLVSGESGVLLDCLINECLSEGLFWEL
jgi:hypothetical protein